MLKQRQRLMQSVEDRQLVRQQCCACFCIGDERYTCSLLITRCCRIRELLRGTCCTGGDQSSLYLSPEPAEQYEHQVQAHSKTGAPD